MALFRENMNKPIRPAPTIKRARFWSQDNVFLILVVGIRKDLETGCRSISLCAVLTCVSEKPEGALGKVRFGSASCQIAA